MEQTKPLSNEALRFEFCLRPIADVMPWGSDPPKLHWFGLTDGWFWIQAGQTELFRYGEAVRRHWETKYPQETPSAPSYEDYQVVRYWEDLMEMLPAILDPIPNDLCKRIANSAEWEAWQKKVAAWQNALPEAKTSAWETVDTALRWWWDRSWGAGHLAHPPALWLWRESDTITLRWDNRGILVDGLPVWEADAGEVHLPAVEFIAAVQSFNDRLIAAMGERVSEIQTNWTRPDVTLDVPALVREHAQRAACLDFTQIPAPDYQYDWEAVRDALHFLDAQRQAGLSSANG